MGMVVTVMVMAGMVMVMVRAGRAQERVAASVAVSARAGRFLCR